MPYNIRIIYSIIP